jgi:hypothetical protein
MSSTASCTSSWRGERLLRGLLGEVEVAEKADQGREDAAPLVAEDLFEDR